MTLTARTRWSASLATWMLLASPLVLGANARTLPEALLRAEHALATRQPDAAARFEHASHVQGESATAEIGMVRAFMEAGEYRRALAFAHLVQGEHTASAEAVAWTAYLMDRSGQTSNALRMLDAARQAHPDDVALLCAQAEVLIDRERPAAAIATLDAWLGRNAQRPAAVLALRHRAALASGDSIAEAAWRSLVRETPAGRLARKFALRDAETEGAWIAPPFDPLPPRLAGTSTGLLLADGLHVITTLPARTTRIFVRDARGQRRAAHVETAAAELGLALLRLDSPIPGAGDTRLRRAARVFAGSPYHLSGFPVAGSGYASYPVMQEGFFAPSAAGAPRLGAPLASGLAGAPVFNASGELAGFVTLTEGGDMIPAQHALAALGISIEAGTNPSRAGNDERYERTLQRVVLVGRE